MDLLQQRHALLRLLGDEDPDTVALVKEQLAAPGAASLEELHALLREAAHTGAASALRELIRAAAAREAAERFGRRCAEFGRQGDLEAAAWELAGTFLPGVDFAPQRAMLEEWGAEAATRLAKQRGGAAGRVAALAGLLGGELGLRGNEEDYYAYANSLLPSVIKTRLGIPISLTLLYQLVGRRAGLAIYGMSLPGHFLARHEDVIFDPFHGGRPVGLEECSALLAQQNLTLAPHHLAPASPRQTLLRMLTNLRYIATHADPPMAEQIAAWETALRGE